MISVYRMSGNFPTADRGIVGEGPQARPSAAAKHVPTNKPAQSGQVRPTPQTPIFPTFDPNLCKECFKYGSKERMSDVPGLCKDEDKIGIIFMIHSRVENRKGRDSLRKGWLSFTKNNTEAIARYIFVLASNNSSSQDLMKENKLFHDIIQFNVSDTYQELGRKVMLGLWWISENCWNSKFIIKTNDDVFINIPRLLQMFSERKDLKMGLFGKIQSAVVDREKGSKYYVPPHVFPDASFPRYADGIAYGFPTRWLAGIVKMAEYTPAVHIEDVFVGLCVQRLGYNTVNIVGFDIEAPDVYNEKMLCVLTQTSMVVAKIPEDFPYNIIGVCSAWLDDLDRAVKNHMECVKTTRRPKRQTTRRPILLNGKGAPHQPNPLYH